MNQILFLIYYWFYIYFSKYLLDMATTTKFMFLIILYFLFTIHSLCWEGKKKKKERLLQIVSFIIISWVGRGLLVLSFCSLEKCFYSDLFSLFEIGNDIIMFSWASDLYTWLPNQNIIYVRFVCIIYVRFVCYYNNIIIIKLLYE